MAEIVTNDVVHFNDEVGRHLSGREAKPYLSFLFLVTGHVVSPPPRSAIDDWMMFRRLRCPGRQVASSYDGV